MPALNSNETITSATALQTLLTQEAELIQQASEALPHSFEKCTYSMGRIRQMVYWCRTCAEPRGICSACSIACHGDHEQVELFAKSDFQCDCPTSCLSTRCVLHKILEVPNDTNTYGQNYSGNFCRCGRSYDAATEAETMVQCVACEDWFHESCLHLRARTTVGSHPQNQDAEDEDDEEDEENDPNLFLKPSEYDSLICGACVRKSPVLSRWAGTPGARMIVWRTPPAASDSGMGESHPSEPPGQWKLLGTDVIQHEDTPVDIEGPGNQLVQSPTASSPTFTQTSTSLPLRAGALKRPLSPSTKAGAGASPTPGTPAPKRARGEGQDIIPCDSSHVISRNQSCSAPDRSLEAQRVIASSSRGQFVPSENGENPHLQDGDGDGDLFMSEGWRERWCRCPDCVTDLRRQPYLLEDVDIYEPPEDPDANFSLEELGMRALEKLPRDKAIDGIRAYNAMRDELMSYLRPFADGGKTVSELDVKTFFESKMAELQKRT